MKSFIYFLPILSGIAIAVQAIVNGQLRVAIGSPLAAALISFLTGTLVLIVLLLITRQSFPTLHMLQAVSWAKLSGGLLGAFFVTAVIVSIQRLPSATMFALIITSQFITALLIDHYGWLGATQTSINAIKIAGVALLIAGAYLIIKK